MLNRTFFLSMSVFIFVCVCCTVTENFSIMCTILPVVVLAYNFTSSCARRHPMDVFSFAKAQPCTTMEAWGMNEIWLQTKYKLQCKLTVLYGAYDQICSAFLYRNKPASQCSTVSPLSFLLYLVTLRCVWPTTFILRFFFLYFR